MVIYNIKRHEMPRVVEALIPFKDSEASFSTGHKYNCSAVCKSRGMDGVNNLKCKFTKMVIPLNNNHHMQNSVPSDI